MTTLILGPGQQLAQPQQRGYSWQTLASGILALVAVTAFYFATAHSLHAGWVAGASVALATGVGALPVAFARKMPDGLADNLMLVGGGIMATETLSGVIPEALHSMRHFAPTGLDAACAVFTIVVLGAMAFGKWQASVQKPGSNNPGDTARLGILLFALAMTLQNLPEGIAAGVSMAGSAHGASLTFGISLQDIPEGFAVATALWRAGASPVKATLGGIASGLVELVGALLGAAAIEISATLLPVLMALAAGAMLWVIGKESGPKLLQGRTVGIMCFGLGLAIAVGFNMLPM